MGAGQRRAQLVLLSVLTSGFGLLLLSHASNPGFGCNPRRASPAKQRETNTRCIELVRANRDGASQIISRFRAVAVPATKGPGVILHGILSCGTALKLIDQQRGRNIPVCEYLEHYLATKPDAPGNLCDPAIKRAKWHPSQLMFSLAAAEPALTRWLLQDRQSWLSSAWEWDKEHCHGLMDLAWFVPACCLLGAEEWTNKFGERINANYLVRHLLEQSPRPLRVQACYGTHNLYALAVARRCWTGSLDPTLNSALNREWNKRTRLVLSCVGDSGAFDLQAFLGTPVSADTHREQLHLHVVGHLVEALAASQDPDMLADRRLHLLVCEVINRCQATESWWSTDALFTKGANGVPVYVTMAHVVRGLVIYKEVVPEH